MCGITGFVNFTEDLTHENKPLEAMTEKLALRGPDASGFWLSEHAALATGGWWWWTRRAAGSPWSAGGAKRPMCWCTTESCTTPRISAGAAQTGVCLRGLVGHRGAAGRLHRMGRGMPGETQRDLCLCRVGRIPRAAVSRPGPDRGQAAVLLPQGRDLPVRLGAQGAAGPPPRLPAALPGGPGGSLRHGAGPDAGTRRFRGYFRTAAGILHDGEQGRAADRQYWKLQSHGHERRSARRRTRCGTWCSTRSGASWCQTFRCACCCPAGWTPAPSRPSPRRRAPRRGKAGLIPFR